MKSQVFLTFIMLRPDQNGFNLQWLFEMPFLLIKYLNFLSSFFEVEWVSHNLLQWWPGCDTLEPHFNIRNIFPGLGIPILTHWGRVTHICVSKLTIIGSDNGLSPDRRQAIIRTNAGILLIRPLGTNFSEILIAILIFSFKKMRLNVSSAKRRPFCLGLNVLKIKWSWDCLTFVMEIPMLVRQHLYTEMIPLVKKNIYILKIVGCNCLT